MTGDHENCPRKIQRFIHVAATKKRRAGIEFIDEYLVCKCDNRGCKCYEEPAKKEKK